MEIAPIKLLRGSHADTGSTGQGCVMNVIAYLNGEPQITDQSSCVCCTARPILIYYNDFADDEQRQTMLPLIIRAMGSATEDKVEISRRLALLVEFANWQAQYAAKYATKYAEYAAESAKYATKYAAESAKYATKYAEYAAESAKYAAEYAEYAAESAKYATKYAAEYAAYRHASFDRGMALLDAMLPKPTEVTELTIARSKKLYELASS